MTPWANTAVEVVSCVLVADFITGLVHWAEDAYATLHWPGIFNREVAEPNIVHHEDPKAFVRDTTFWGRNYVVLSITSTVCMFVWLAGDLSWHVVLVAIIAGVGNETHAWCHTKPPYLARLFQEMGLLTTPLQHAKHHRPPYDRSYCTVTNLLNPILDAARFWRVLELILSAFGLQVRRMQPERRGV